VFFVQCQVVIVDAVAVKDVAPGEAASPSGFGSAVSIMSMRMSCVHDFSEAGSDSSPGKAPGKINENSRNEQFQVIIAFLPRKTQLSPFLWSRLHSVLLS
jgi:hypothetical protein